MRGDALFDLNVALEALPARNVTAGCFTRTGWVQIHHERKWHDEATAWSRHSNVYCGATEGGRRYKENTTNCGNSTFFLFFFSKATMDNKRKAQRQVSVLAFLVNMAPGPGHSSSLVWSSSWWFNIMPAISVVPPSPPRPDMKSTGGNADELSAQLQEPSFLSFLTLFIWQLASPSHHFTSCIIPRSGICSAGHGNCLHMDERSWLTVAKMLT